MSGPEAGNGKARRVSVSRMRPCVAAATIEAMAEDEAAGIDGV